MHMVTSGNIQIKINMKKQRQKKLTPEEVFTSKLASLIKFNTNTFVDYYEGRCDDGPELIAKDIMFRIKELILPYEIKFKKVKLKKNDQ